MKGLSGALPSRFFENTGHVLGLICEAQRGSFCTNVGPSSERQRNEPQGRRKHFHHFEYDSIKFTAKSFSGERCGWEIKCERVQVNII